MSARSSLQFPNNLTQIPINSTAASFTFVHGASGKQVAVYRMKLIIGAATTLQFLDGGNILDVLEFPTSGSIVLDFTSIDMPPWYQTSAGKDLVLSNSNAVSVTGNVDYLLQETP